MKKLFSLFLAACLMLLISVPALGADADFGEGERVSLAIGGEVTNGKGFLKNFSYITQSDMESIRRVSSGEATYRLGLGDSFSELLSYSAYENHGTPTWTYRRGYGIDLELLAESLGVDCSVPVSIFVSSSDGMTKTLPDAFGLRTARYCFGTDGRQTAKARTSLLLYETASAAQELGKGVFPQLPQLGADSSDAVENVFAFGQTANDEVTSCFWVKSVQRLRFGSEAPAVSMTNAAGKVSTAPISAIVSLGVWTADFGTVRAQGVPLGTLLEAYSITIPDDKGIIVKAEGGEMLFLKDASGAFLAFSATDSGSAVSNSTALKLYTKSGESLGSVTSLAVGTSQETPAESGAGQPAPAGMSSAGSAVINGIFALFSRIAGLIGV